MKRAWLITGLVATGLLVLVFIRNQVASNNDGSVSIGQTGRNEASAADRASIRSNIVERLRTSHTGPLLAPPVVETSVATAKELEQDAAIAELVRLLDDPKEAAKAARQLREMNNRVIPALLIAVTNSDLQVRRSTVVDLGYRHTNVVGVVTALLDVLLNEADSPTRRFAADALGKIPDLPDSAIQRLIETLANEDRSIAAQAAQSLGRIGPRAKDAVPSLEAMYRASGTFSGAAGALAAIDPTSVARLGLPVRPPKDIYE